MYNLTPKSLKRAILGAYRVLAKEKISKEYVCQFFFFLNEQFTGIGYLVRYKVMAPSAGRWTNNLPH